MLNDTRLSGLFAPGWGAVGQRYSLVGFLQRIAGFSHPSGKIANKPDYLGKIAVRQVQ